MWIRREDLRSPAGEHSSPLPCSGNILMRTSLMRVNFFCSYFANFTAKTERICLLPRPKKRLKKFAHI